MQWMEEVLSQYLVVIFTCISEFYCQTHIKVWVQGESRIPGKNTYIFTSLTSSMQKNYI